MLKRQLNKSSLFIILAMAVLAVSVLPVWVVAKSQDVLINLGQIEGDFEKAGVRFDLWYISGERLPEKEALAQRDALDKLDVKTLNEKYPEHKVSDATDGDGKVVLKDLKGGAYYVRQQMAEGATGDVVASFIINLPSGESEIRPKTVSSRELKLKKVDDSGNPLAGASFEIYRIVDGKRVKIGFTGGKYDPASKDTTVRVDGADGTLILKDLPEGEYILKEVQAPTGYEMAKEEISFTIRNGQVTELVILNKKLKGTGDTGEHRFLKYDGETNEPLAGATFKVTRYDETSKKYVDVLRDGKVYMLTSDEKGEFKAEGLSYGKYFLFEVRSPEAYELESLPIAFTVDANSAIERLDIPNHHEDIEIPGKKPNTGNKPGTSETPLTGKTPSTSRTPLAGKIPKTGDISLLISVIGGGVMVGLGMKLIKREDE